MYLPGGKWHDFWDGMVFEGGREHAVHAEYDTIPVFVRENCILPLADPVEAVGNKNSIPNPDKPEPKFCHFA